MNNARFLLLAVLASTGATAGEIDAPFSQPHNSQFNVTVEESGINNSLSNFSNNEANIHEYAERVFVTLAANIEEAFLENLEQQFSVRLSNR